SVNSAIFQTILQTIPEVFTFPLSFKPTLLFIYQVIHCSRICPGHHCVIFLLWDWYFNLERAYEGEGKIRTGNVVRVVDGVVTWLFWVRFPGVFSIFGI